MQSIEQCLDPFGIASSFWKLQESWNQNQVECSARLMALGSNVYLSNLEELCRLLSGNNGAKPPAEQDSVTLETVRRNAKIAQNNYSILSKWMKDFVATAPGFQGRERDRAIFWTGQLLNAMAPSNYFWTNPGAVQKYLETKGDSLRKGLQNWAEDVARGDNLVLMADPSAFKVGENLATTPGCVIFRNRLIELIQYSPTTQTTYPVPIVLIQPWINKFYIFDLNGKSLVQYLRDNGFTVFMVSWKNPSSDMREINFEDYMLDGALKAIEVAKTVCGVDRVHAAGYCIGGTALSALLAWMGREEERKGTPPIADCTLFATMVDFSEPGELGVYISESSVEMVEDLMKVNGYLDSKFLGTAFRLLRSESLIWYYFVKNYLQGGAPPKSDILYWNSDSTRLPEAMASFYLREFYLKNNLVKKDAVVMGKRPIDLSRIEAPLYVVGAEQDHIAPWKQTFKICNLAGGQARYVLSGEGHIIGFVNPPTERNRKTYWVGAVEKGSVPEEWRESSSMRQGSWWTDWTEWLRERSGEQAQPPAMGGGMFPSLGKAPGTYVLEP